MAATWQSPGIMLRISLHQRRMYAPKHDIFIYDILYREIATSLRSSQ